MTTDNVEAQVEEIVEQDPVTFSNDVDVKLDKLLGPLGWLIVAVALISFYEIISRYVFGSPTLWVYETSYTLIGVVFLLSGIKALARNTHVQIDLLEQFLPHKAKAILRFINRIILLLVTYALTYISSIMAWASLNMRPGELFSLERTGTSFNSFAPAIIKTTLFISCVVMAVQATFQLYSRYKELKRELSAHPEGGDK
ncbi:TRAP transporter small permease subunit [Polycladidibacter stylochi]|uniref:TRAP transporter small permease subunit n=1 Tax=Polycladidibacter stylochi TaxID=1807766 RepID=UPI00082EBB26|nr:TRAP transporter small permease [Pseudovibrio stylochi]